MQHRGTLKASRAGMKNGIEQIELLDKVRRYAARRTSGHHRSLV